MKKLLSLVVALIFVLTSMSATTFAAVSDDVTDAKVKTAVDRLVALGLISGMEDGKFHPEQNLTREQAAKIVVEGLGLSTAAAAAKGSTQFNDVTADRWSSGYIAVAAGQGIVKGTGNGNFSPEAEVTYAQVITMLVRALGYKDEFLPGVWPGNYVARAASLDIDDGVTFDPSGVANRGAVAILTNNTLDEKMVDVDTYKYGTTEITYSEQAYTLMEKKLDVDKVDNIRIVENRRLNDSLESNEATVESLKDGRVIDGKTLDFTENTGVGATKKVDVKDGIDLEANLGMQVKGYFDGNELIYLEKDESGEVATDLIFKVNDFGSTDEIKLKIKDKEYTLGNDDVALKLYVNGDEVATPAITDLDAGMFGKFVIRNNKVVYADVFDMSVADTTEAMVVTKVDTTNKIITGIIRTDKDEDVNIEDDFDNSIIRNANGATMKLEDIKANDVVYVLKQAIDGDDYAVVTVVNNNTVTGKFGVAKSDKVKVADKSYDISRYNTSTADGGSSYVNLASFTSNSADDIYDYVTAYNDGEGKGALEDLDGGDVTAIKDIGGQVVYVTADVKAVSGTMYGVVTKIYADGDKLKVFTKKADGKAEEVAYNVNTDEQDAVQALAVGMFVKFKLNKDGEIAEDSVAIVTFDAAGAANTNDFDGTLNDFEMGKDSIDTNSATFDTYKVTSSTVIYEGGDLLTDPVAGNAMANTDDLALLSWSTIKEKTANGATDVAVFGNDKGEAEAVLFYNDDSGLGSDNSAAYVIDKWKSGSDYYVKIKTFGGTEQDIKVDSGSTTIADETPAVVKVLGNGKLSLIGQSFSFVGTAADADFTCVTGNVYDRDGDNIRIYNDTNNAGANNDTYQAGEVVSEWYRLDSGAVIYHEDGAKSKSNITNNKVIKFIVREGYVKAIEIE